MAQNSTTGQLTTNGLWQVLPVPGGGSRFSVYSAVELLIAFGDTPTDVTAFKILAGDRFEWPDQVRAVNVKGVTANTVYYIG